MEGVPRNTKKYPTCLSRKEGKFLRNKMAYAYIATKKFNLVNEEPLIVCKKYLSKFLMKFLLKAFFTLQTATMTTKSMDFYISIVTSIGKNQNVYMP